MTNAAKAIADYDHSALGMGYFDQKNCPKCKQTLDLHCFPYPDAIRGRYRRRCYLCYYTPGRIAKLKSKRRKRIKSMCDSYIANLLAANTSLCAEEIPKELIILKRIQLAIKRITRNETR